MDAEPPFLLAIDQGTTSTRAILFDAGLRPLSAHAIEPLARTGLLLGYASSTEREIYQGAKRLGKALR